MATGTLGCANRYDAAIHWQGGKRRFYTLTGITSLTWSRKLGDYSEATVTLAKPRMTARCFDVLSPKYNADGTLARPGVQPWAHELSIYRDGMLVWQGPIVLITENRDEIELNARDMLAWMDRRVVDVNLHGGHPDGSRFRGETGAVLRQIFERTWPGSHETNPHDNPGITEHARIDETPGRFSETERIWKGSRTVGDLVRDLVANGIDMFTLGRKVYLVPDFYRVVHQPYRLSSTHLLGDVEVRTLGLDMATEGFVVSQAEGTGQNSAPVFGKWPPQEGPGGTNNPSTMSYYGRITRFHEAQSLSGDTQQSDAPALQQVAQSIRAYGFPPPKAVIVGDSAALAPEAPITIGQLVPGRVVRVELDDYISDVSETFRLNEIEVTWSNNASTPQTTSSSSQNSSSGSGGSQSSSQSDVGGEQVKVSLATLRNPPIPSEDQGSSSGASSGSTSSSSASAT